MTNYFILRDDRTEGPFTVDQLATLARSHKLDPAILCAKEGDSSWQPIGKIIRFSRSSGLEVLAGLLIAFGGVGAAFFLFIFDVTVQTELGPVNNIGLMSDRQNGVIAGFALVIIGILLLLLGRKKS